MSASGVVLAPRAAIQHPLPLWWSPNLLARQSGPGPAWGSACQGPPRPLALPYLSELWLGVEVEVFAQIRRRRRRSRSPPVENDVGEGGGGSRVRGGSCAILACRPRSFFISGGPKPPPSLLPRTLHSRGQALLRVSLCQQAGSCSPSRRRQPLPSCHSVG